MSWLLSFTRVTSYNKTDAVDWQIDLLTKVHVQKQVLYI